MRVGIVGKDLPVKGKRWVIEDHELGYFSGFNRERRCPMFSTGWMAYSWSLRSEAEEFARKHGMEVGE